MNPIFQAAAESARLGWLMGILTGLFLVCFVGWTWWAFSSRNKALMEEASRIPLNDGDEQ
jgi:cytochrome c oxidase cbb3-type subunit 4